jgi:hypothetical protein
MTDEKNIFPIDAKKFLPDHDLYKKLRDKDWELILPCSFFRHDLICDNCYKETYKCRIEIFVKDKNMYVQYRHLCFRCDNMIVIPYMSGGISVKNLKNQDYLHYYCRTGQDILKDMMDNKPEKIW